MPNVTKDYQCADQKNATLEDSFSPLQMLQNVTPATPNTTNEATGEMTYGKVGTMLVANIPPAQNEVITVTSDEVTIVSKSTAASSDPANLTLNTVKAGFNNNDYSVGSLMQITIPSEGPFLDFVSQAAGTKAVAQVVANTTASDVTTVQITRPVDTETFTAISKADPGQFTCATHGLTTGEHIRLSGFRGTWAELNSVDAYTVTKIDNDNFTLSNADGQVDTSSIADAYDASVNGGLMHVETAAVSAATSTADSAMVFTSTSHNLLDSQTITFANFSSASGWDELNGKVFRVTSSTTDSFEITELDSGTALFPNVYFDTQPSAYSEASAASQGKVIPLGMAMAEFNTNSMTQEHDSAADGHAVIQVMPVIRVTDISNSSGRAEVTIPNGETSLQAGDIIEFTGVEYGPTEWNGTDFLIETVSGTGHSFKVTLLKVDGAYGATTGAMSFFTSSPYTQVTASSGFFGLSAGVVLKSGTIPILADSLDMTFITENIEPLDLPHTSRGKPLTKSFAVSELVDQVPQDATVLEHFFGNSSPSNTSAGYFKKMFALFRNDFDILFGTATASKLMIGKLIAPTGTYNSRKPGIIATDVQLKGTLPYGTKEKISFLVAESTPVMTDNSRMNAATPVHIDSNTVNTFYGAGTYGDNTKVVDPDPNSTTPEEIGRLQMKVFCPFLNTFGTNEDLVPLTFLVGDNSQIIGRVLVRAMYDELKTRKQTNADGSKTTFAELDIVLGTQGDIVRETINAEVTEIAYSPTNYWQMDVRLQLSIAATNEQEHEVYVASKNHIEKGELETFTALDGNVREKFVKVLKRWRSVFSTSSIIKPSAEKIQAPDSLISQRNYVLSNSSSGTVVDGNGTYYAVDAAQKQKVVLKEVPVTRAMIVAGLSTQVELRGDYKTLYSGYYATQSAAESAGAILEGGQSGANSLFVHLLVELADPAGNLHATLPGFPSTYLGQTVELPTTDQNGNPIHTGYKAILGPDGTITELVQTLWPFFGQFTGALAEGDIVTVGDSSYTAGPGDVFAEVDTSILPQIPSLEVPIPTVALNAYFDVYGDDNVYAVGALQVGLGTPQLGAYSAPVQLKDIHMPSFNGNIELVSINPQGHQTLKITVNAPEIDSTPTTLVYTYGDVETPLGSVTTSTAEFPITLSSSTVETVSNSDGSKDLSVVMRVLDPTNMTYNDLPGATPPDGSSGTSVVINESKATIATTFIKAPSPGDMVIIPTATAIVEGNDLIMDAQHPILGYLLVPMPPVITSAVSGLYLATIENVPYSDAVLTQSTLPLAVQPGNPDTSRWGQHVTLELGELQAVAAKFQAALTAATALDPNVTQDTFIANLKASIAGGLLEVLPEFLIPIPNVSLSGKASSYKNYFLMDVRNDLSLSHSHYNEAVESLLGTPITTPGFGEDGQLTVQTFVAGISWRQMTTKEFSSQIILTKPPVIEHVRVQGLSLDVLLDYGMQHPGPDELATFNLEIMALVEKSGLIHFLSTAASLNDLNNTFVLLNAAASSVNSIQYNGNNPIADWPTLRRANISLTFSGSVGSGDKIVNGMAAGHHGRDHLDIIFSAQQTQRSGVPLTAILNFDDTAMEVPILLVEAKNTILTLLLPAFHELRAAKATSDTLQAQLTQALGTLADAEDNVARIQQTDINYLNLVAAQVEEAQSRHVYLNAESELAAANANFTEVHTVNSESSHHGEQKSVFVNNAALVRAAWLAIAAEPGAAPNDLGFPAPAAGSIGEQIAQDYINSAVNGFYPTQTNVSAFQTALIANDVGLPAAAARAATTLDLTVQAYEANSTEANALLLINDNKNKIQADMQLADAISNFSHTLVEAGPRLQELESQAAAFATLEESYNSAVLLKETAAASLGSALEQANTEAAEALATVYGAGGTPTLATADSLSAQSLAASQAEEEAAAKLSAAENAAPVEASEKWLITLKPSIENEMAGAELEALELYVSAHMDADIQAATGGASDMKVSYYLTPANPSLQQV